MNYPNVPNLPGVPPVLRNPYLAAAISQVSPIVSGFLTGLEKVWGVYDENAQNLVLTPDSIYGIDYLNSTRISDYPVEAGGFDTYNKVNNPRSISVSMRKGGTSAERSAFLQALESMVVDINLYTIVTPDTTIRNVNLERFDYRREARNGASLIIVACHFTEIRTTATASYPSLTPQPYQTNIGTSTGMPDPLKTASPQSVAFVSNGGISPLAPPPVVQSVVVNPAGNW